MSNYQDYLNSDRWAKTKARFKQSKLYRGGRCFICCNKGVEKHIHHLTYKRLGHENMNDLRILCGVCHAAAHRLGTCKQMRKRWHAHASRNRLWRLKWSAPGDYAYEVARFFRVLDHPFVKRIIEPS